MVYARSTSIRARQDHIEVGIGHVRDEVMPVLMEMDGCIGLSMLVDRQGGRCIATSAWHDEERMRASDEALCPLRDRLSVMVGGGRPEVEEWEIAILHRDHTSRPGACVRATWVKIDPAGIDHALEAYRSMVLPAAEGLDGFCSASLLMNRSTGRSVSSVTFDSQDALEGSRDSAAWIRDSATAEARVSILDVCEFELTLAHLRVPEMA
jgi:hypothetical protein